MDKISAEKIIQVLGPIPGTLRKLASERDFWKKEAQSRIRKEEAAKVATAMHDKGLETDIPFDTLVERLEKAAEQGQLGRVADAVNMLGPDMGKKIAQLSDNSQDMASSDELTACILGNIG